MSAYNPLPSQAELKELFTYDNGRLIWKTARRGVRAGAEAGSLSNGGYLQVRIKGKRYAIHRVIYTMHCGYIPDGAQVDHINMQKLDNRIENLRLVSNRENGIASTVRPQANSTTGVNGVDFDRCRRKYRARITVEGKHLHLGYFGNIEEAATVRRAAEFKYGFNALANRPAESAQAA